MAKELEIKVDAETLKNQEGNLTDEQINAIADEAYKEIEPKKKPEDEEKEESTEDKLEEKEDDGAPKEEEETAEPSAEEKAKQEQERIKEEERIINAKDEDLKNEEKTRKAELVKARESKASDEIKAYAKENSITEEDAKEELESIARIQEKYKGDPKQLAKANLYLQRLESKANAALKAKETEKANQQAKAEEVTVEAVIKYFEAGKATDKDGKPLSVDYIISSYRNAYPDLTESLDDDKVLKLASKEYADNVNKHIAKEKEGIVIKAKEKRATMFDSIPETDKRFIQDIKPLIEKLSDTTIMDPNFDLGTYIAFAKGNIFDATIQRLEQEKKEFGDKEYNRGLEESKILGTKSDVGGGGKSPKSQDITLTEEQKKRAREMFDNPDISEEKAFEMYKDYLKETNEKL
uniref:Uncharacterized protein n=1 Tax=viral metagenome TaxID=1070528 RepID=A0A6M3IJ08_9ZZZZ